MKTSKNKFRYILIVIFSILFLINLLNLDYTSFPSITEGLNVLVPILMIIAMLLSIKHANKYGEN